MREALSAIVGDDPRKCRHPGHPALWIGAYVGDLRSDLTKSGVVKKAAAWTPDGAYEAAYEAWKKAITDEHTHVEEMVAASPVIVGLAAETPIETSITLHYPYGVPIIPGSALKGLARSYARLAVSQREGGEALAEGGEACKFLFGTQEQAGQVTFLDAWWAPTAGVKPLHQDVMTPHPRSTTPARVRIPSGHGGSRARELPSCQGTVPGGGPVRARGMARVRLPAARGGPG